MEGMKSTVHVFDVLREDVCCGWRWNVVRCDDFLLRSSQYEFLLSTWMPKKSVSRTMGLRTSQFAFVMTPALTFHGWIGTTLVATTRSCHHIYENYISDKR